MRGHSLPNLRHLKDLQSDVEKCAGTIDRATQDLLKSARRLAWGDLPHRNFDLKFKEATSNAAQTTELLKDLQVMLTGKIEDVRKSLSD